MTPTSRPDSQPVPVDELDETPEERALVEQSRADHARTGKSFSQEEVEALIARRKRGDVNR